jgi:hypothetical protein
VALENSDENVSINRAWRSSTENDKISAMQNLGYYELQAE